MEGQLEPDRPTDPAQLRVSDAERHQVAEILREAAGEGRIDLAELDERLEAAYAARTYADLVPITVDLPAHRTRPGVPGAPGAPAPTQHPHAPAPRPTSQVVPGGAADERHLAFMSGMERKGVWVVPQHLVVTAVMGGANLDLREAQFAAREVVITVNAFMGGADIVVGPHVNVVIEGTGIMGGYSGPSSLVRAELDEHSPTVRIRGVAVWGGVSVKRRNPPGTLRRRILGA
ncbi:DUF1707 and DUF2154 domain-containing protein [Nocardioides sp. KIGAM211]|uniref:DUF1707 and DUF2154 domain-containing protein n=1 Tax=Nocardioides luti TaxID=2761101 RepID=A0A7X0RF00_9ACTN|nr:DUF1707 domain-containing protein [Nocardioides luti]MBB6626980.1 DUF1707 and DUF2154 domain-containing protein [Nocardioides luti]